MGSPASFRPWGPSALRRWIRASFSSSVQANSSSQTCSMMTDLACSHSLACICLGAHCLLVKGNNLKRQAYVDDGHEVVQVLGGDREEGPHQRSARLHHLQQPTCCSCTHAISGKHAISACMPPLHANICTQGNDQPHLQREHAPPATRQAASGTPLCPALLEHQQSGLMGAKGRTR